jgi:preprotein translocase subunit SecD
MDRRLVNLILILTVVGLAIYIDLPSTTNILGREISTVLGLDLRGGTQVLLQPPEGFEFSTQNLEDAARILENRSNGLGVSEVMFQIAGDRYILGEFPGLTDTAQVVAIIQQTGLLEFVDTQGVYLEPGTEISTDYIGNQTSEASSSATVEISPTPETAVTPAATPTTEPQTVYHTIMTGSDLRTIQVTPNQTGGYAVAFELSDNGAVIFRDFTTANVDRYLAIVLDGAVVSCPTISTAITDGRGEITGNFTSESANSLAITLRYGSLPIPLQIAQSREIGPSLGQDSLDKSLLAGTIGFIIVTLFMILYYRLPGFTAVLSILVYGLITFAIFRVLPVTLTLPGIAGLLISTGSALDANILIFERMREELRNGRTLRQSLDLGWRRAWSSIRDSNFATIITSVVLFVFGSAYGASIVKGFALTLALGVAVSLLCAIFVTRTLLGLVSRLINPDDHVRWFGA